MGERFLFGRSDKSPPSEDDKAILVRSWLRRIKSRSISRSILFKRFNCCLKKNTFLKYFLTDEGTSRGVKNLSSLNFVRK